LGLFWQEKTVFLSFFLLFSCAKPLFLSQKGITKKRRQNEVGCIRLGGVQGVMSGK